MINEQDIILQAKGHIRLKNFAKARILLQEVQTNRVAANLLKRLDAYEVRQKAKLGQGGGMAATPPKKLDIPRPAIAAILGGMLFWAVALISTVSVRGRSDQLPFFILGTIVVFVLLTVAYYLFWRFYWWMLAFVWILASFFLAAMILLGVQIPHVIKLPF